MKDNLLPQEMQINQSILHKWQDLVNIVAELISVPAALIMRILDEDIEVFLSSKSTGNPYSSGDREHFWGSGLYCETVIKSNKKLLIPNALKEDKWKNNPDIKLNMISYLGFPIRYPDGKYFGTICVLDSKENKYSKTVEGLLESFRDMIQYDLELGYMNLILGEKNKNLLDHIDEIKTLRGIIPICSKCKKIKDDKGYWMQVEKYIESHSDAKFSHGLCKICLEQLYGDQKWFNTRNEKD